MKKALQNQLQAWINEFKAAPYLGFGYNDYKKMAAQALDNVVSEFMRNNFNVYDEAGRLEQDWQEIDAALDFYENVACDLRSDATHEIYDFINSEGINK